MQPFHANVSKRIVKSPKVYLRDSGLLHTLLRLDDIEDVLGHPVVGQSWEGFVLENLIRSAPERRSFSYYRTSVGAEIDLIMDLGGKHGIWAMEIKRSTVPKICKGFHMSINDIKPSKAFIVYAGDERYSKGNDIEAIRLTTLCAELRELM